jgi:hypothetical protein
MFSGVSDVQEREEDSAVKAANGKEEIIVRATSKNGSERDGKKRLNTSHQETDIDDAIISDITADLSFFWIGMTVAPAMFLESSFFVAFLMSLWGTSWRSWKSWRTMGQVKREIKSLVESVIRDNNAKFSMFSSRMKELEEQQEDTFVARLVAAVSRDPEVLKHLMDIHRAYMNENCREKTRAYSDFFWDATCPNVHLAKQSTILNKFRALRPEHFYLVGEMYAVDNSANDVARRKSISSSNFESEIVTNGGQRVMVDVRKIGGNSSLWQVRFSMHNLELIVGEEGKEFVLVWVKDLEMSGLIVHEVTRNAWTVGPMLKHLVKYLNITEGSAGDSSST